MQDQAPTPRLMRTVTLLIGCAAAASNACGSSDASSPAPPVAHGGSAQAGAGGGGGNTSAPAGAGGNAMSGSAGGAGTGGVASSAGNAGNGGDSGGSAGNAGGSAIAGSAGTGAGTRGYYSTNRDEFLGATRCAGLDVALCEDFESGTFDAATWTLHNTSAGDLPVIDALHVARGAKAAHFHAANNDLSYILEKKTFPALNNSFWGRMFLYIDALPVTPDGAHFTLIEAVGTGDTSRVREGGQFRKFGVGTDGGPSGDWTNIDKDPTAATAKQIPEKQWICVEWQYKGDSDETHFFWDGVEHPSLHTFPAVVHNANPTVQYHLPQFTSLWIGWWMYQANPSPDHYDVWIDEVAIDKARIGCSL